MNNKIKKLFLTDFINEQNIYYSTFNGYDNYF